MSWGFSQHRVILKAPFHPIESNADSETIQDAPGQLAGGTAKAGGTLKAVSDPSDVV